MGTQPVIDVETQFDPAVPTDSGSEWRPTIKRVGVPLLDGVLAIATGTAAAAAVLHRLDLGVWFDEAFSYGMATQSWQSYLTRWFWGSESNMALY